MLLKNLKILLILILSLFATFGLLAQDPEISLSRNSIIEQEPQGTIIGSLNIQNVINANEYTFFLDSNLADSDNEYFRLINNHLVSDSIFDYIIRSQYIVKVFAKDNNENIVSEAFLITILKKNNTPYNLILDNTSIFIHDTTGTVVANISVEDLDITDTHIFTIESQTSQLFSINQNELILEKSAQSFGTGDYTITISADDSKGGKVFRTFIIQILPSQVISVQYENTTVCKGQNTRFSATGDDNFSWYLTACSPENKIGEGSSIEISFDEDIILFVKGVNYGIDSVAITISHDFSCYPITVYNLVSPNGDGKNDYFYIENLEFFSQIEVSIQDKFGNIVYEESQYNNDWNAENLDPASYVYNVYIHDLKKTIHGTIVVVK